MGMHGRDEKGHRIRDSPESPQEYLRYDYVVDTGLRGRSDRFRPEKSLQRLEGAHHARYKRLPRKRRDVELLSRPAFAHGSLKGIGKAGFKRR